MLHARTWAEVDLDRLARNLAFVRSVTEPETEIMLVVKADAYGHGAVPVSWHLLPHGVAALGVGDSTEALELRDAGITAPIVVLGAVVAGELDDVVRGDIQITVHSGDRIRALRRQLERNGPRVRVHLKVDTGMGRLGCRPERVLGIAREIQRSRRIQLEGVSTHLASAGSEGEKQTQLQLRRFKRVLSALDREGLLPRWQHIHSSTGVMRRLPGAFNLVRPGIAVYGTDPSGEMAAGLQPALNWRTQVVFLKDHRKGARIGYGGTWTAERKTRVATLPVGYNDGYRFAFSNRAEVLVRGHRCPVIGRVSMDYICLDVTDLPGTRVGDVATLLGTDGEQTITVSELADLADTIPYEILCGIGRRVKRSYVHGAEAP